MTVKASTIKRVVNDYVRGTTIRDNAKKNKVSDRTVKNVIKGAREGELRVMEAMNDLPEIDELRRCNGLIRATGRTPAEIIECGSIYNELVDADCDPLKMRESYDFWRQKRNDSYGEYEATKTEKEDLEIERDDLKGEISGLESEKRSLKRDIGELKTQWQAKEEKLKRDLVETHKETINELNSEISELNREADELDDYAAPLKALSSYGIEDVGRAVDFYRLTRDQLILDGAKGEDIPILIPSLVDRFVSLTHCLAELVKNRSSMEAEITGLEEKIGELKGEKTQLESDVEAVRSALGDLKEERKTSEEVLSTLKAESLVLSREAKVQSSRIKLAEGVMDYLMNSKSDAKEVVDAFSHTGRVITPSGERELLKALSDPRVRKRVVDIFGKVAKDQYVGIGEHSLTLWLKDRETEQLRGCKRKYDLFCKFLYNPDSLTDGEREELKKILGGIGAQRETVENLLKIAGLVGLKALD